MPEPSSGAATLLELAKQLLFGALGWPSAELTLTKLDAKALLHRYVLGLILLVVSFAVLTATVFTLAETVIGALAEYVHGNLIAGLIVSAGLFCLTAVMIMIARSSFTKVPPPKGMVFKRLLGNDPRD